jgi:asparaginyl-tRNA synthetase
MPGEDWKTIKDVRSGSVTGQEVKLRGWIYRTRASNKYAFVVVRDSTGIVQITYSNGEMPDEEFALASSTQVEASVVVSGSVKEDDRAPGGYELQGTHFEVVGDSDKYPIGKDQSEEFLRDKRHLWIRSRKMTAIMKVRSTVTGAIHEFFRSKGYHEFTPPIFQPVQTEGGATLFEVKYYDKKLFLAQTWQLYAEAAIFALEKIYDMSPTFRAEKSKTSRHLTEFWMAEMEVAWIGYLDVIAIAEEEIKYILKKVLEENKEELEFLQAEPERIEKTLDKPWPVITYTKALETLKDKAGMDVEWGKDLRTVEEEKLMEHFETPVTVMQYPKEVMAFYKPVEADPDDDAPGPVAKCFDMLAPEGYGEIIGGSERDTDVQALIDSLTDQGEDPENYEWYFDLRKYGSVPHSGYGVGVERLISWICKLDNIKDAIPFPRTITRFAP